MSLVTTQVTIKGTSMRISIRRSRQDGMDLMLSLRDMTSGWTAMRSRKVNEESEAVHPQAGRHSCSYRATVTAVGGPKALG